MAASSGCRSCQSKRRLMGSMAPVYCDHPSEETTYWLTLAIGSSDLAEALNCKVEDIEAQDYIGGIRDHGEVVKIEEVDS